MSGFAEALRGIVSRVPETQAVMIIGTDGIPIDKLAVRQDPNFEAITAEYSTLLRQSVTAAGGTGLGTLRELAVVTEKLTALIFGITPEYFLLLMLSPGALTGRARFALRIAGQSLEREFV